MGNEFNAVLNAIGNWLLSIPGFLTMLIIAIISTRVILTKIRNKEPEGRQSHRYKNAKMVSGAILAILMINYLAALIRRLFGLGKQLLGYGGQLLNQSSDGLQVITNNPTVSTTIFIFVAGSIMLFALVRLKPFIFGLGAIVATIGSYILSHDFSIMIFVACFTGILWFFLAIAATEGDNEEWKEMTEEKPKKKKKGKKKKAQSGKSYENQHPPITGPARPILFSIFWLSSVILAYIAGEKSLLEQVNTCMKTWFQRKSNHETKKTDTDQATTVEPVGLQPIKN